MSVFKGTAEATILGLPQERKVDHEQTMPGFTAEPQKRRWGARQTQGTEWY